MLCAWTHRCVRRSSNVSTGPQRNIVTMQTLPIMPHNIKQQQHKSKTFHHLFFHLSFLAPSWSPGGSFTVRSHAHTQVFFIPDTRINCWSKMLFTKSPLMDIWVLLGWKGFSQMVQLSECRSDTPGPTAFHSYTGNVRHTNSSGTLPECGQVHRHTPNIEHGDFYSVTIACRCEANWLINTKQSVVAAFYFLLRLYR